MFQNWLRLGLDPADLDHRRDFAVRAMGGMIAFLVAYSLGEVVVWISLHVEGDPLTNLGRVPESLALNLLMIASLVLFRQLNIGLTSRGARAATVFPWSSHAVLLVGLPFVLGHIHLAGSQSNPNAMLLLVYVICAQRMLGSRSAWRYLALAELGYLALVLMERAGLLPYAPLQADRALGETFLHLPHVLINFATFTMVAVYLVAFMARSEESYLRARDEIRELRELMRMCAWCKKVQGEDGAWRPVEHFLAGGPRVSHGMCPSCSADMIREG